jgi:hypothetical protein
MSTCCSSILPYSRKRMLRQHQATRVAIESSRPTDLRRVHSHAIRVPNIDHLHRRRTKHGEDYSRQRASQRDRHRCFPSRHCPVGRRRRGPNRSRATFIQIRRTHGNGIDPIVYARLYAGREAAREMEDSSIWDQLKTRMARSVIILCEPVAAFLLDDGVRLMPDDMDEWMRVHREFCDTLQDYGLSYHVVGDRIRDLTQRREFVVSKWLDSFKDQAKPAK